MSVALGPELRARIWAELDWSTAVPKLAAQVVASENMTAAAKAPYLRQLAELCEFCVLDPQAAADLYGASYQADRTQADVLPRMRRLCAAMGRYDHAARTAELEFRQSHDPRFQAMAGQFWLDAAEPDRALKPLLAAAAAQSNPHLAAALEVARREWANPESHAEALIEIARNGDASAAIKALQAARILHLLDFDDERFEDALQICLRLQPNLPSACNLMDVFLLEHERYDDLAQHYSRRAAAASSPAASATILLTGSGLLFRAAGGELAVPLFAEGLRQAVASGEWGAPGVLAQLRAVAMSGADARVQVCAYGETFCDSLTSVDEQMGVSIFCAQIAWYAQKDFPVAGRWMDRIRRHSSEHKLLVDFELAAAILQADEAPAPAPAAAAPKPLTPPGANPGASEKRRAPRVAIATNIELKMEVKDRMGIVSKIDAVTRDISTVGAMVRCDKELKLDQLIDIVLQLPSSNGLSKRRFAVRARVARIVPGRGLGLEWVDSDYDFKTAIAALPDPS